jgi:amino acid adenylation domain-containing protein
MGLQVVLIHSASEYANIPMNFHIDAGQAAYGIYTSGSTGDPKCALNSHRGICNKLRSIQDQFRLDDGERILHKTPVNFDVSVIEIFWPLTTGATSVLMEQDGHKNPQKLHEIISEMNINIVHFVPSMLRLFIEQMNGRRLTSLRLLLSGGEALSYDLQKQTIAAFPGTELVNQYGPTEAAVDVTAWCFNDLRDDLKVPIGKPNANVELHVLDKKGVHVPLGVSGELYIGGPQVGLGYLHREDLTEKSFVSRKIGQCYERLYRTGDKVRWLADGNLEYLGRLDDQVKLRGFRIELAEIEHHLNQFSSIDSALVLIQNTAENGHQLVAYIKLNPELSQNNSNIEQSGIVQTLKARLSERLPGYMVPEIYVRIEEWPLTFNGKIDKKRLPKSEGMMLQAEYIAPNTDAERKMIGIWSRLLGMKAENISALANFFELGGHSLLSIKLLTEIRRTFDIELALQQLFTLNTVRELAQYCEMLSNEKELSSAFGKSDEVNEFEF